MIDYQQRFKQKLVFLLLLIFLLPLLIISFLAQSSQDIKQQTYDAVQKSKTLNLRGKTRDIALSKQREIAYVCADSRGVYMIDLHNPLDPKLLSQFKYFQNSYDKSRKSLFSVSKDILFVQDAQAGIYSVDLENIAEPKLLSSYTSQMQVYEFAISSKEDYLYLSDQEGIKILDIKESDRIQLFDSYESDQKYLGIVEVKEKLLYLLSSKGVDILDVNIKNKAKVVGNYIALGDASKIEFSSDKTLAFIASKYNGIEIVDTANKLNPKPLSIYKSSEPIEDIFVSKDANTLYVTNENDTLEIVSVVDPRDPKVMHKIKINQIKKAKIWDFDLFDNGNIMLVANGINGLKAIELK